MKTPSLLHRERLKITDLSLDPSGEKCVSVVRSVDETGRWQSTLRVNSLRNGELIAEFDEFERVDLPKWSTCGSRLAVRAKPANGGSGSTTQSNSSKRQIWVWDPESDSLTQATTFEHGVNSFDWANDGRRLAVDVNGEVSHGTEIFTTESRTYANRYNMRSRNNQLYVSEVDGDSSFRLDTGRVGEDVNDIIGFRPQWSPVEDEVAFLAHPDFDDTNRNSVSIYVTTTGGEATQATNGELLISRLAWGPNGERIAFIGRDAANPYLRSKVYLHDVDGATTRSLTDSTDGWAVELEWVDEDRCACVLAQDGRARPVHVDTDGTVAPIDVGVEDRFASVTDVATSSNAVVAAISTPSNEPEIVARRQNVGQSDEDGDAIYHRETLSEGFDVGDVTRERVESPDGVEVDAYVYYPPGVDAGSGSERPAVVSLHEADTYLSPEFDFYRTCWLHDGYVVVEVGYRGSVSQSGGLGEQGWENLHTKGVSDVTAVLDALVAEGEIDRDRLFAYGFSRGAVLLGYLVVETDLFAAGAASRGVYDLRSSYGLSMQDSIVEEHFGLPWEASDQYEDLSILEKVADVDTPLLLLACGYDSYAPDSQSRQLYARLKESGVPARLVVYRNQRHKFRKPEFELHHLREVTEWFAERDGDAN